MKKEQYINSQSSIVVDDVGNAFACLGGGESSSPYTLLAFDYKTGETKWAVDAMDGDDSCGGTPLLLVATGGSLSNPNDIHFDPVQKKKQLLLVYHFTSKYMYAHRSDGTIHFKSPVFLEEGDVALGVSYLPMKDVLVGISRKGYLFIIDRRTGKLAAQIKKVPCAKSYENECMISPVVGFSNLESRFYFTANAKDESDTDQWTDFGAIYGVEIVNGEIDDNFRFRIKFFAYATLGKINMVGKQVSVR